MFPTPLRKRLDELYLRLRSYCYRRKAVYKYFLNRGMPLSEILKKVSFYKSEDNDSSWVAPFKMKFFLITKVSEHVVNYSFYTIDYPSSSTDLRHEPMAIIDGFLIQRKDNFDIQTGSISVTTPYYFSVYSHTKGSLEYGPFEGYSQAQLKIAEIKAIVNMNEDNELRYYSDPYCKRYGYTDALVQQALEVDE